MNRIVALSLLACLAGRGVSQPRVNLPRDAGGDAPSFYGHFDTRGTWRDACDALEGTPHVTCMQLAVPNAFKLRLAYAVDGKRISSEGLVCVAYGRLTYHFFSFTVNGAPVDRWLATAGDAEAESVVGAIYAHTIEPIALMRGTWRREAASR